MNSWTLPDKTKTRPGELVSPLLPPPLCGEALPRLTVIAVMEAGRMTVELAGGG
jgi:hypothetical protein